jgi:hypothetical protein
MSFLSNPAHHELRLPKDDVNKFDGSNPMGWVTQLEHHFSLHGITNDLVKLRIGVLYLDLECWKLLQGRKNSHRGYIACTQFVADLYECFDTNTHHLGCLTKLKQSGIVEEYIIAFEQLNFQTNGMFDTFFEECLISVLKDDI